MNIDTRLEAREVVEDLKLKRDVYKLTSYDKRALRILEKILKEDEDQMQ